MANLKNLGMIGAGAAEAVALTFGAARNRCAPDDGPTLPDPPVDAPDEGDVRLTAANDVRPESIIWSRKV